MFISEVLLLGKLAGKLTSEQPTLLLPTTVSQKSKVHYKWVKARHIDNR